MKKILLVIFILISILGGATYWFFDNLDDFIKDYMVDYGSKMTQTEVEIDSVKTDLKKGEITINRLGIENPKGFSNNEAFEVGNVMVIVKKESLNQDIIEIPLVLIKNPEILYEYNGDKTNFDALKDNIQAYQSVDDNSPKDKKVINKIEAKEIKVKNSSKTFFIQEIKIENLEIKVKVSSIRKPPIYISFHCPPLTKTEIDYLITILTKIYKNMYIFKNGKKNITKKEILQPGNIHLIYETIVFDNN